jgi:hypothetical protein
MLSEKQGRIHSVDRLSHINKKEDLNVAFETDCGLNDALKSV